MSELNQIKHGYFAYMPAAEALNESIISGFEHFKEDPLTNKTHFFEGRYENIYITTKQIPSLEQMIKQAIEYVAEILGLGAEKLQCGFWFNSMQSGDITLPHRHDDDDELMSAVYYVLVPANSGCLVLGDVDKEETVEPEAGKFVFFKSDLIHQVTKNLSESHRLSIGMNFGLKDEFKTE